MMSMIKLDGGAFAIGLVESGETWCYAAVEGHAKVMQLPLHYGTALSLGSATTMMTVVASSG